MSFSFDDIKYGWKIIAGVVLTGATIFVVDNTRQRVLQRDTIQPILGTHERCLAANVEPLEFVRSWYSNAYDGTNAILYTNTVTNCIGWRVDRSMLTNLDAKIEELAPYFADTNTVYDGTTNIVMHTFTGLLTSLDIGDHTNFTTYGWYVSQDDLKERYKVLNKYEIAISTSSFDVSYSRRWSIINNATDTWANAQTPVEYAATLVLTNGAYTNTGEAIAQQTANEWQWGRPQGCQIGTEGERWYVGGYVGALVTGKLRVEGPQVTADTNLTIIRAFCEQYILETNMYPIIDYGVSVAIETNIFHSYYSSDEIYTNASEKTVKEWTNHVFLIDFPSPDWTTEPTTAKRHLYGARYKFYEPTAYLQPAFQYCTNKFW